MFDLVAKESSQKWKYNLGFISILVESLHQKHTINDHQINVTLVILTLGSVGTDDQLYFLFLFFLNSSLCIFFISCDMNVK